MIKKREFYFVVLSLVIGGFVIFSIFFWNDTRNINVPTGADLRDHRKIHVPSFDSDSAYSFIAQQVSFGPRKPNTSSHAETKAYLVDRFKEYGAEVIMQDFQATSYNGLLLSLTNIIASYYLENEKRILLVAHWDTRPVADKDKHDPLAPFDGANDGASGVGVLLEVARLLSKHEPPAVGIDIVLFDGEDSGPPPAGEVNVRNPSPPWDTWWCLGSQYWSKNKHQKHYMAYYGILLDMVGAKDSNFYEEGVSKEYASRVVRKIWDTASRLGYGSYFVKKEAHPIVDDHVYVNQWAKIPMVDIVHYDPVVGYFGDYHHTQDDNMDLISKETLSAVGNTLLHVIYYEEE